LTHGSGIVDGDLHGFFNSLLIETAENRKVIISPNVTNYVTDLLVAFHETASLFAQEGVRVPVLTDMLTEALEADYRRRITIFRQMGDTSLMVSGFFPEALSRRALDINYYQKMGEIAYSHLGSLTVEVNVFDELSQRFMKLSELLNEIADSIHAKNYPVSKLLEFYTNTGSEHVLEQLKKQGIIPITVKKKNDFDE
jgi:hypothetical protein